MTEPNPLASLPLAELQPLAALLGTQPEEIVGQVATPLVNVLNQQLFPVLMVAWACLGIVLYDGAIHFFKHDVFLFRRWRNINILYLVLRYVGTASAVFYTIWSVLGQTSLCDAEAKAALFLQAFATLAASGIFYVRIATLTNRNKLIMIFFAVVALADFGLLIHAAADGVFGAPPPSYAPLITCIPGEYTRLIVALPCYVTVFYDLCVLAVTFNALRKFRQEKFKGGPVLENGQTTGSDLKWILLRDNTLYVGVVSAVELAQGIIVWFNISPLTEIILTPVVIAVTVVMGCRVFVQLKFVAQSDECKCRVRRSETTLLPSRSTKATGEMKFSKAGADIWAPAVSDSRMDTRSLESGLSHESSTVGDLSVLGHTFNPSSHGQNRSLSVTSELIPFEPTEIIAADIDEIRTGLHLPPRMPEYVRANATSRISQSSDNMLLPIWQTYSRHGNDGLPPPRS